MRTVLLRLAIVVATCATALVPAWVAPASTIKVPTTLARSVHSLDDRRGTIELDYPATHLAFSWIGPRRSKVRFRMWSELGVVSSWSRAPEVHGPESLQADGRHFSAVLAVDRITRVEWEVGGRGRAGVRRVTLDYLNTVDGPSREVEIPVVANAAEGPPIVTRAQWGADESLKRSCTRNFYPLQQIFVHHTAGKNYDADPKATMRAIYWYHVVRQGWCDIGYNFVIGPGGTVFEGRYARRYKPWELHDGESTGGRVVAGAHTGGYNSGSLGVSMMGNYSQIPLPPAARRSLVELLAWEVDRHDLDARARHVYRNPDTGVRRRLRVIAGHRDAGQTACPGSYVYSDLRGIRRDVANLKGAGRVSTEITLESSSPAIDYGSAATFAGTLTNSTGAGLVGRTVGSYVRWAGGRWRAGPEALTGEGGSFELTLDVPRNSKVIAVYEGDAATWGAQSPIAGVRVAPVVTIEAEGGTEAGGISHHPGGTTEVALAGTVAPPHVNRSVIVRVERSTAGDEYEVVLKQSVDLDDSSGYRFVFPVPGSATYRAVAIFRADLDHAGARSDPVTFVVGP